MKKPSDREELMIRYLLGQLPEKEQLRVEEQFFTDEESYQELLALEDELRYDYATGELTGSEREQFKERFLVTPEDRKKVVFASALISKVAPPAAVVKREVVTTSAKSITWWQQVSSLFKVQNPVVRYAFAAAVVVLLLAAGWVFFQPFRKESPKETAAGQPQPQRQTNDAPDDVHGQPTPPKELVVEQHPPQPSPSRGPAKPEERPVPSVATFLLMPGLIRDSSAPKELVIGRDDNLVQLKLSLKRKSEHRSYRAVLRTLDGVEVWNRGGLPARNTGSSSAVIAQLPTRLLAGGDYELVLQGATASRNYEDVDEYYFRIVKK